MESMVRNRVPERLSSVFQACMGQRERERANGFDVFFILVPKIFTMFYAILKPFFSEYTQSKIQLFGSNAEEWRNFLRSRIPHDQLPSEYGGSNTTSKWVNTFSSTRMH